MTAQGYHRSCGRGWPSRTAPPSQIGAAPSLPPLDGRGGVGPSDAAPSDRSAGLLADAGETSARGVLPCQSAEKNTDSTDVAGGTLVDPPADVVKESAPWLITRRRQRGTCGPSERKPIVGRLTALEQALLDYKKKPGSCVITPKEGVAFDSYNEAFNYYNLHSWEKGFGIRCSSSETNRQQYVNMKELVCMYQGWPGANIRGSMRCGCKSRMVLRRTDDHGWYIRLFVDDHNHKLSGSLGEKSHWSSHKHLDMHTTDIIKQLRSNNVNLSNVYGVMTSRLKPLCGAIAREVATDDIETNLYERSVGSVSAASLEPTRAEVMTAQGDHHSFGRRWPSTTVPLWQIGATPLPPLGGGGGDIRPSDAAPSGGSGDLLADVGETSVRGMLPCLSTEKNTDSTDVAGGMLVDPPVDVVAESAPWIIKRQRQGGTQGPSERKPIVGRLTALEQAMLDYKKKPGGCVVTPEEGVSFDSYNEAFNYYNLHSWEKGFGIRCSSSDSNRNQYVVMKELVCMCQGWPGANIRRSVRCGCKSRMVLRRTGDHGWYIRLFVDDHNHKLSGSLGKKRHWSSHKHLDMHTMDIIKQLKSNNNVNLSKALARVAATDDIETNLCGMPSGSIAKGDLNFKSTQEISVLPPPSTHLDNLDDPEVGVNPFSANLEGKSPSDDPINLDEEEHVTSSSSGKKRADNGKKRKQSQVAGNLQEYADFKKQQTKTFVDDLDRKTKPNDDYSIKNCIAVLESIEEISDAEKAKAIRIFKFDQNREIFLNFKRPTVRLLWIQGEIAS